MTQEKGCPWSAVLMIVIVTLVVGVVVGITAGVSEGRREAYRAAAQAGVGRYEADSATGAAKFVFGTKEKP